MDVGDRDKVEETDKGNEASVNYHLLMGMIPQGDLVGTPSFISMVNSFGPAPALWDHPANSQSVGFNGANDHSGITTFEKLELTRVPGSFGAGLETGWEAPKGGVFIPTGPGFSPHSIAQFPADSAFIERAARFSCFSTGNIADMVHPFGLNHAGNAYHQAPTTPHNPHAVFGPSASKEGSPKKIEKKNGGFDDDAKSQEELSLIDAGAEPSSAKGLGSKKRKRGGQDSEAEQSGEGVEDNDKQNPEALLSNKANGENGKQSSQASDPPKEGYIHVRARRGQATNSHSLAERVRREKISERMKFLQDLVPGCSKVTGKAVMLDEIINYVQSLQRQVEFLSMKLATVNPRLDFNIESLLAKEQMLAARAGPLGFSPDMSTVYPQLHTSQPAINQPGLPVIGSSSDALRNINPQLTSISDGYNKEPTPQMHLWDGELHNIFQMGFSSNTSSDNQDTSSPLPPSHTKVEL